VREKGWTAAKLEERARTLSGTEREKASRLAENMSRFEWKAVNATTEQSLKELGYSTRTVTSGGRCAIEASGKGHAKLLVLIEDKGARGGTSHKSDWANLADMSCLSMQKELEDRMAQHGVSLADDGTPEQRHQDPRGGQLIREAGSRMALLRWCRRT